MTEKTVPKEFVLAALFSGIGRLQKRACPEQMTGSVVGISRCWLAANSLGKVATTLTTWEAVISKAAALALGLQDPSGEDAKRLEEDTGNLRPLLSLFSQAPVGKAEEKKKGANLVRFFSPHSLEAEYAYPSGKQQVSQCDYKKLWKEFEKEITDIGTDLTTDAALVLLENYTASVPCLLAPELETDPQKDPFSDISLFDHLKMTAAIASCLYLNCMEEAGENEEQAVSCDLAGSRYRLIGGDFSGVQDFIYRISSKGALKTVRGRSFFLEMLTHHVVAALLEALGLSRANVLYAAGAQFSILAPGTCSAASKIEKIGKELNTYLLRVHGGKLYLVLESHAFGNAGFAGSEQGWKTVRRTLGERIGDKKKGKFKEFFRADDHNPACRNCGCKRAMVAEDELKRWGLYQEKKPLCRFCFLLMPKTPSEQYSQEVSTLEEFSTQQKQCLWCKSPNQEKRQIWKEVGGEIVVGCQHDLCLGQDSHGECQVCHQQTRLYPLPSAEVIGAVASSGSEKPDVVLACAFCRNLYHLGEHLPDLKCIRRTKQRPTAQPRMLFKIGEWYYDFPKTPKDLKDLLCRDTEERGWLINSRRDGNLYQADRPISPLYVGNYHPPRTEENRKEKKALDFSDFAQAATGSSLIGALRMDIDNLGDLFTRRFSDKDFIPVRTSALSRLLTRFFTEFINALCAGKGMPPSEKAFRILEDEGERHEQRWVTVIYSGGDDLFIIGAWSEVIELAFDIQTAFRAYVCQHPNITVSGGLTLHADSFPLYQMAALSEQAEKKAKKNTAKGKEKNSFAPFHIARPAAPHELPEAFCWEEAETLRSLAQEMVNGLKDKSGTSGTRRLELKVPRSILSQLFEVVEMYEQEGKLYLSSLHYILAEKEIPDALKKRLIDPKTIEYLSPVLTWLDLMYRGEA